MNSRSRTEDVFVGRQQEMGTLVAALDDALAGRGRLVMLAGEPGIGKTRITQELASYAEKQAAQVLWGWCYEGDGAPPYWPWAQPIRSYVRATDADRLRAEMGPGGADIADMIPEVRDKLPGFQPPPLLDPDQARFRLFASITAFLKNAAQTHPMVLVLDDLQWADRSSLLLLEFLAREMRESRLLVLGAYRDVEVTGRHQLSQTLGSLVREQHFHRLQLSGLTQQEVSEFVEASVGLTIPDGAVDMVYRRTEGNPLFVGEIVRLLKTAGMPSGSIENRSWSQTIPEGVRAVIGRRLSRLSEPCVQALRTASVVGRDFDFQLLNALCIDIGEDRLLEAIDEAQAVHLIEESPGAVEHYQFCHALIQETLSQELTASRRVRMHARIGETLEALQENNPETKAAELAYHYGEAESVLGAEKSVNYSRLAGEQALAIYGHEEALGHFQRALVAKNVPLVTNEPAADEEAAVLLFGLARAQIGRAIASHTDNTLRR